MNHALYAHMNNKRKMKRKKKRHKNKKGGLFGHQGKVGQEKVMEVHMSKVHYIPVLRYHMKSNILYN
jgi:hypothetical protein